jgi:hypothetical protein
MVFVPSLAIGKKEIEAFCKHHCFMASAGKTVFAQLQRHGAFIAAFTR